MDYRSKMEVLFSPFNHLPAACRRGLKNSMKHITLTDHSANCSHNRVNNFLFQVNFDFAVISYCSCNEYYSHLDFKGKLLKSISTLSKLKELERGFKLYDFVKNNSLSYLMNYKMKEVVYDYMDNANKQYGFVIEHSLEDFIAKNITYKENRIVAFKYIDKCILFNNQTKEYLKGCVCDLQRLNSIDIGEMSDISFMKFSDLLIKKLFITSANLTTLTKIKTKK